MFDARVRAGSIIVMDSVPLLFVKLLLVFHCVNSVRANDEEVEVVVLPMTWGIGNATVKNIEI